MTSFKQKLLGAGIILGFCSSFASLALAAQPEEYVIAIGDHKFSPAELLIPAHQKVKLVIENHDATAEEFESYDLHREKVVLGHGKIIILIGPLQPGAYKYFGEFHPKTAVGFIQVQKQ